MEENISSDCEINNQPEQQMDYDFTTLPPHVLANILSHLPMEDFKNASQTCKPWYYASCDPISAKRLFLYFTTDPTDSMDIFIRPVTRISFMYVNLEKFDYKTLLRNFGHMITELYINSCARLRMTQLFEMFIYLPNLKLLSLDYGNRYFKPNNYYKHGRITKQKARIMRNLGRVEELHITTTEKNLKGAEVLLNYCTNLKKLYWNENLYSENPDYFLHNVLVNQNNNCTSERLESLTVHTLDRKQNSKFFEHLINLNRRNLRSLDLKEISDTYYDVMFKEFCKAYYKLKELKMNGCNDQQLVDICKYMRDLKSLNLDNITATNFSLMANLKYLEVLTLRRTVLTTDDLLIELFRLKPKNLTDLSLNSISTVLLKEICENLPQLKRLRLECINTKECEPIFRHLTKLEQIHLEFAESSEINSKLIQSDPEWNVSKLVELEDFYVSTFLPGFTPDFIAKLPKLKTKHHEYIYDPPDPADVVEEENEANEEEDNDENVNENEAEQIQDVYEEEAPAEETPVEEENREYDPTEFDFFSEWFSSDSDIIETVIHQ